MPAAIALVCCAPSAPAAKRVDFRVTHDMDGVCFPVRGTGHLKTRGYQIAVGPLSPVYEGDTVLVSSGEITLLDFRSGKTTRGRAGDTLFLQHHTRSKNDRWAKLKELVAARLTGPEKRRGGSRGSTTLEARQAGGAADSATLWPDGVTYAPGVAVVLQWAGVPGVTEIVVTEAGAMHRAPAGSDIAGAGSAPWAFPTPGTGPVVWQLMDRHGRTLARASFEVLTAVQAGEERARYEREARAEMKGDRALGAALRAARDGKYLW